jgi:hypothetical protein
VLMVTICAQGTVHERLPHVARNLLLSGGCSLLMCLLNRWVDSWLESQILAPTYIQNMCSTIRSMEASLH